MKNPFKKKKPELDMEAAQQMLANVFDACNYEHNTVPIEVLSSYSNYRRERYSLQKRLLIGMMILFLLLPFLFISPELTVFSLNEKSSNRISLTVSSWMPVARIYATLDDMNIPVYEVGSHEYIVQPTGNGKLHFSVTLINQQTSETDYLISGLDTDPPVLLSSDIDEDRLILHFSDEISGISASSIHLTDAEGAEYVNYTWDDSSSCLSMHYPETTMHLYISDLASNTLHLLLTPQ